MKELNKTNIKNEISIKFYIIKDNNQKRYKNWNSKKSPKK